MPTTVENDEIELPEVLNSDFFNAMSKCAHEIKAYVQTQHSQRDAVINKKYWVILRFI